MYTNQMGGLCQIGTIGAAAVTSTGVLAHRYLAMDSVSVTRIAVVVGTTISSAVSVVINVKKRPTIGSSSGEVSLGTLTIPTGAAAPAVYYKDINDPAASALAPGQEIAFDVTTASTSAGSVTPLVRVEQDPEVAANQSALVASA